MTCVWGQTYNEPRFVWVDFSTESLCWSKGTARDTKRKEVRSIRECFLTFASAYLCVKSWGPKWCLYLPHSTNAFAHLPKFD